MVSDLESAHSTHESMQEAGPANWLKVGAVAVASALAAGLAVNWFYSKSLNRLRQAEAHAENSDFRIPEPDTGEDD